jgi:hypothetical protein
MRRRAFAPCLALAALTLLGLASPASAGKQVPFKGDLEGSFTSTFDPGPPPIATFDGSGEGHGTHLGAFTYEFPHTVDFGTAPPTGNGTYTFTAANGDTLVAKFIGHSTPVGPGLVFVEEEAVVVDGTGRFEGATGEFTISRLVDQINGTTTGSFEGTISSRGKSNR